jgi:L-ascorbate metabolism protein UlaG (beta-lactamase superfamily)
MSLIGEIYEPEIAILPIGDHYTMGPLQAAYAARLLGSPEIVPGHYGTFALLTGTPQALREALARIGVSATVHEAQPGEVVRAFA